MFKTFEEGVSEIQKDMIEICLEYCENKASKIFIYASLENKSFTSNFFFEVNGKFYKKHKLKDVFASVDTSIDIQKQVINILNGDLMKFSQLCEQFEQPLPTEIKLVYDIKNNRASSEYEYNLIHSNHKTLTPNDVMSQWLDDLQSKEN